MMNNPRPINVFILDDEFPVIDEFRENGIYNSAISTDNLYHLAVNSDWKHLIDLQQLIKDIVSSEASKDGYINLVGFSSPTQALSAIKEGLNPDIIIYDWEYPNAPIHSLKSQMWLLDILEKTTAFVFVYSKMRDELPRFLNGNEFSSYSERFQLFKKGLSIISSFSSEEFILQYIIGSATNSGKIKIDGIEVEFTSNNYLRQAGDILYLQRILGSQYVLDQLKNIDFSINTSSVEKILNDSNGFLYLYENKGILISPDEITLIKKYNPLTQVSYLKVAKDYSIYKLEEVLEKGIAKI